MRERITPDGYEKGYTHPAAWKNFKKALAGMGMGLSTLADQLQERTETGTPRLLLAWAIHHFLTLSLDAEAKAMNAYFLWSKEERKDRLLKVRRSPEPPPAPRDDDDDKDNDNDNAWTKEGEEWKGGGGGTLTPDAPAKSDTPSTRDNPLAWIRKLIILHGQKKRSITVYRPDRVVEVTPDVSLRELLEALGQRWRTDAGAPSEDLPDDEKATEAEFNAFVWKLLSPPGWKMPENLPASTKLSVSSLDDSDRPPLIISGATPREWQWHCPVCGRGYRESHHYANHLERVHGWARCPKGYVNPPDAPRLLNRPDAEAA